MDSHAQGRESSLTTRSHKAALADDLYLMKYQQVLEHEPRMADLF